MKQTNVVEAAEGTQVVFFIDMQQFKLDTDIVTVGKLFELAEENPAETTIALKKGNDLEKFTDVNQTVHLKNGMKFVVLHNEPTPVS